MAGMSVPAQGGVVAGEIPADRGGLIHAFVLDGAGGGRALDWDGVDRWRPDDGILWLNLDYTGPDAQGWLTLRSGLDPIVRDALLDPDPRPRALPIGDALLLILRAVNLNTGAEPEDMVSFRCWIEPRRIITLRHRTVRLAKAIARDLTRGRGPHDRGDFVAEAVVRILDPLVTCVDGIDDAVASVEDVALEAPARPLRHELAVLRRRAIGLRRFIAPQREAFARLAAAELPWLDDQDRARLREAADRLTRTVEELDAARDRAAVTHELMASRVGEITNQRLYVLSIITAIFLPLGFVTSLLGVNVGGVPGRDVEWGFWVLCGVFACAIAVQLWLFRRWRWL
jgi:zinc transporter